MPNEGDYVRRFLVGDVPAPVGIAPVDSHGVDAFGRVRVSQPADTFDTQFEYDLQPLYWDSFVTGSARVAHMPSEGDVAMFVSGTASVALRQSRGYLHYQPGKSQLLNLTYQHTPEPRHAVPRWLL